MIKIGISGWNYRGWRGNFYPKTLSHKSELEFASKKFPSIEINGTFYSLKNRPIYQRWYQQTPKNFIFSLKANRYITHIKRLNDIYPSMQNFFSSGVEELKEKLGPILWQFPPNLRYVPEKWEEFLSLLPQDFKSARKLYKWKSDYSSPIRHAIEVRNISFYDPHFIKQLRKFNVSLVFSDNDGRWPYMEDITGDFIYLRLHGHSKIYSSNYEREDLLFWKRRILTWSKGLSTPAKYSITKNANSKSRDIFVYFDNDAKVNAPFNALSLMEMLKKDLQ